MPASPHDNADPLDPAAEARLDAALRPTPLDPALRERLLALHAPLAAPAPAAPAAPPVTGRIGFRRPRLAAAAGLAAAATLGVGALLLQEPATQPAAVAVQPEPPAVADPEAVAARDPDPVLLALDAAAAAADPEQPFADAPDPGSAASRLAELEATGGDPWARSAWAAAEADALFAAGPSPAASLF